MKQNYLIINNTLLQVVRSQIILIFLFLFLSSEVAAQSFTSESSLEEQLIEIGDKFVELLNTTSEGEALSLGEEIFKKSSAKEWTLGFRKDYGIVKPGRVRLTVGTEYQTVHVIVKVEKLNAWRNFQLVFGNSLPKRSARINIVLAAKPTTISPGLITDTIVLAELNNYIDELEAENTLSGSLLITKGAETLLERVFGIANKEKSRSVTNDTPFNLASGGKMFTAVAILRLVQSKKLNLNDPISKFLPEYPDKAFAKRVTVAHLLSHTSGLGDFWDDEFERHWNEIKNLQDYLPFVAKQPLLSQETGNGAYSNSGFILLGLIIERITGQDYYEHIEATIFKPLSMKHTGFYRKSQDEIFAVGYLDLGDGKMIRTRGGDRGSSAGGAYSTTRDMFKFRNALLNHQLLNKEMLKLATSEQARLDGGMSYGYGFSLNETLENGFGHGGRGPGASTAFEMDIVSDLSFISMSNIVNGAQSELFFTIKDVLTREK